METPQTIHGISSMATKALLAELADDCARRTGVRVAIKSVGGVDAARRVAAGERFDIVVLASDAIDRLIEAGHLGRGSRVELVRSPVAIAVRAGAPRPDVSSEAALKQAVLDARRVSCSTGPSGDHLGRLFERWGIAAEMRDRLVKPPPGVPVGSLVARGDVALGFQQLSELMHLDGVDVIGPLPDGCAFVTTFCAGLPADAPPAGPAHEVLACMTSPETAEAKRRHGMEPA